jgi:hypothetical protein
MRRDEDEDEPRKRPRHDEDEGEPPRKRRPPERPQAQQFWMLLKLGCALLGTASAAWSFVAESAVHGAVFVGAACFLGICARLAQAEEHRFPP